MRRLLPIVPVLVGLTAAAAPSSSGGGGWVARNGTAVAEPERAPAGPAKPPLPAPFVCPIKGPVTFGRDFGAPRGNGRAHAGNDLFSSRGTENVAVVPGTLESPPRSGGGVAAVLRGDDGNRYVYLHLLQLVGPVPRRVQGGEVVGLTGSSGPAQASHTHFEFHPAGGPAADPYPLISAYC